MKNGRSTRFLILPALMFLFLMSSEPSQGIDSPVTRTVAPTQPSGTSASQLQSSPGTIAAPASSGCMLTSVSPACEGNRADGGRPGPDIYAEDFYVPTP